ncbi:MAG: exonuclease domain-containing protein [Firmicutes bacterium]|nr:exonuclease domain-containing protein [Bacillota bacterium]
MRNTDRLYKGQSIISLHDDYIVIDIETTGLSPSFDKIIEIAAIKIKNNEIVDQFKTLVNPGFEITEFIEKLTGINNDMLTCAPYIESVLNDFNIFIGDSFLLGHNVSFDINFLYDAYMEHLNIPLSNDFIDLLRISRREHNDLENHKLKTLAEYFDIDYSKAHRALEDCIITNKIFHKYKKIIIEKYGSLDQFLSNKKGNHCNRTKIDIREISLSENCTIDPTHPFYDKSFVFTGALNIPRTKAAQIVVDLGGHCELGVTKITNYLVIGNFDYIRNINGDKSNKIKKAESLILKGQDLVILSEDDFFQYLKMESENNE